MKVVIFDSHCNLCSRSVYFVARREKKQLLRFTSNRSAFSSDLFKEQHVNSDQVNALLFWEDDKLFWGSDAALHIARHLRFPWFLLYGFLVVPFFIREPLYQLVAKHRHRWFGINNDFVSPEKIKDRFLD